MTFCHRRMIGSGVVDSLNSGGSVKKSSGFFEGKVAEREKGRRSARVSTRGEGRICSRGFDEEEVDDGEFYCQPNRVHHVSFPLDVLEHDGVGAGRRRRRKEQSVRRSNREAESRPGGSLLVEDESGRDCQVVDSESSCSKRNCRVRKNESARSRLARSRRDRTNEA